MKIGSYPLKYTKFGSFSQRSVLRNPRRMLKARFIVKEQFFFFFLLSFSEEEVESKDMLQCYFQVLSSPIQEIWACQ